MYCSITVSGGIKHETFSTPLLNSHSAQQPSLYCIVPLPTMHCHYCEPCTKHRHKSLKTQPIFPPLSPPKQIKCAECQQAKKNFATRLSKEK